MQLKVQSASPIPIYLQIVEQIRYAIAAGILQANDELPSVRALAVEHLINPNTVARAYLELERENLLSKRRGAGTYVSARAAAMDSQFRERTVGDLLEKAVATAAELGLTDEQVRRLLEERLKHAEVER
jgi:GntR family transcriptional regulator